LQLVLFAKATGDRTTAYLRKSIAEKVNGESSAKEVRR